MTILITGSAGFIGTHLAEYYLQKGYKVIGIDNYITGSVENTVYLTKKYPEEFFFIRHDVCNDWKNILFHITETLWIKRIDYVFFLSSPASVKSYQKYPLETLWTNTTGLHNCLIFADWFKARLIFTSTSEIYGSALNSPQKESDWGHVNSFGPRSCYDEAKRFGEALIYTWNMKNKPSTTSAFSKFSVEHGIVRIFNTYGPRMHPDDDRAPNAFMLQALAGKDLTVFGDGKQTRSFCYADDLIQGLSRYAESKLSEPINLGNDAEITILELAETVLRVTGSKSKIIFNPLPQDDPPQRRPDLTLAKKHLDYKPQVTLEAGLKKMISPI